MSRPTGCNNEVIKKMILEAGKGGTRKRIANAIGISESSFYIWMIKGRKGYYPYKKFYDSFPLKKYQRVQYRSFSKEQRCLDPHL